MGYALLSKEFEDSMRAITMMGYGLIFTTHIKEEVDEEGRVIGYRPDLPKRCLKIVNAMVDVIGVIYNTWDENGNSKRWIQTRATPQIAAGSRYRFLAPTIPFGYRQFVEALSEAIDEEEKHGATVVDKLPEDSLPTFEEIRNEAAALWKELVSKDETNAERIMKSVEKVFGRQIRLSEITEDMSDLFYIVLVDMRELNK